MAGRPRRGAGGGRVRKPVIRDSPALLAADSVLSGRATFGIGEKRIRTISVVTESVTGHLFNKGA